MVWTDFHLKIIFTRDRQILFDNIASVTNWRLVQVWSITYVPLQEPLNTVQDRIFALQRLRQSSIFKIKTTYLDTEENVPENFDSFFQLF